MAMLFQWFGTTALLPSGKHPSFPPTLHGHPSCLSLDNTGAALEQLKNDVSLAFPPSVLLH